MVLVVTAGNPRGTWPLRGVIKTCPVFQLCPTVVVSNDDLRKGNGLTVYFEGGEGSCRLKGSHGTLTRRKLNNQFLKHALV